MTKSTDLRAKIATARRTNKQEVALVLGEQEFIIRDGNAKALAFKLLEILIEEPDEER